MDPRTNGPVVYENMETSIPGVFASGNVVHVHDLVDFVSDESEKAGRAAGKYVTQGELPTEDVYQTKPGNGLGYIVPQKIRKCNVEKGVEFFFRVREVQKDVSIQVRDEHKVIASFKREHMAPGEMEKVFLPAVLLDKVEDNTITIDIVKDGE